MKSLFLLISAILVLLYVNSFILKDNNLFIPPPENVTQQFFKKMEAHRFKLALEDLSETSPYKRDPDSLKDLSKRIEKALGEYEVSRGKSRITNDAVALSNVSLKGKSGKIWPVFLLTKEKGLWKIETLVSKELDARNHGDTESTEF